MCFAFFRKEGTVDVVAAHSLLDRPEIEKSELGLGVVENDQQIILLVEIENISDSMLLRILNHIPASKLSDVTQISKTPSQLLGGDERERLR